MDRRAVCTLMAGNRFWNRAVASLSSGRPAKLFMTTSGGAFHMESGWRGRASVAVTSFISEYSWICIVSVGPCTAFKQMEQGAGMLESTIHITEGSITAPDWWNQPLQEPARTLHLSRKSYLWCHMRMQGQVPKTASCTDNGHWRDELKAHTGRQKVPKMTAGAHSGSLCQAQVGRVFCCRQNHEVGDAQGSSDVHKVSQVVPVRLLQIICCSQDNSSKVSLLLKDCVTGIQPAISISPAAFAKHRMQKFSC